MRKNKPTDPSDLQLDLLLVLFASQRRSGELVAAVEEVRRQDVPLATFYRQLQRTTELGWIEEHETADGPVSQSERGRSERGRPERPYRITDHGSRVLRDGMQRQGRRVDLARSLGLLAERR